MASIVHTLEKLINMICKVHNKTALNEKLFMGKLNKWYQWYLSKDGAVYYDINSILFITTFRGMYVKMYKNFIIQLKMYASAIRVLSMGYLPISPLPPIKLRKF